MERIMVIILGFSSIPMSEARCASHMSLYLGEPTKHVWLPK